MLGAAPGQTIIADSTTVVLYKLIRAALAAVTDPARTEIVLDTDNFPTDRYLVEGIAREEGLTLRWIDADPASGVTVEQVRAATGPATAVVVLSQIAYRSGFLADLPGITAAVHDAGALVVWDLCHSAGSVEIALDAADVDFAAGCTYKYLNGGPGSPAFAYVNARHLPGLQQPIWGWMGRKDAFEMGPGYEAAAGIRGFLSGTPAIFGMLAMRGTLDLLEEVGHGRGPGEVAAADRVRRRTPRRLARPGRACELVDAAGSGTARQPHHGGPPGVPGNDGGAVGTGCHSGLPRAAGHPDRAVAAEHVLHRAVPRRRRHPRAAGGRPRPGSRRAGRFRQVQRRAGKLNVGSGCSPWRLALVVYGKTSLRRGIPARHPRQ